MTQIRFFMSIVFILLLAGCVSEPEVRRSVKIPSVKEHVFITVKAEGAKFEYSKKDITERGGIPVPKYSTCTIMLCGYLNLHPRDVILSAICRIPAFGYENNDLKYVYDSQTSFLELQLNLDDVFSITSKPLAMEFVVTYLEYNKLVDLNNVQEVYLTEMYTFEFPYISILDKSQKILFRPGDYSLNAYSLQRDEFLLLYDQVRKRKIAEKGGVDRLKNLAAKIDQYFLSRVKDSELLSYLKTFKLLVSPERQ